MKPFLDFISGAGGDLAEVFLVHFTKIYVFPSAKLHRTMILPQICQCRSTIRWALGCEKFLPGPAWLLLYMFFSWNIAKFAFFRDTKVGSGSFLDRRMLCHATNYSSSTGQSISPDPYFPHFAPLFAHPETPIDSRTRTREGRTFLWSFSPLMMFSHDRTNIVDRF